MLSKINTAPVLLRMSLDFRNLQTTGTISTGMYRDDNYFLVFGFCHIGGKGATSEAPPLPDVGHQLSQVGQRFPVIGVSLEYLASGTSSRI